jgi:hypothetical protein
MSRKPRPHLIPPGKRKVKKGALHKKNGPKSRLPVLEPNTVLVEYYARMKSLRELLEKAR